MPYIPTSWVNGSLPAINSDNLNNIETGIANSINKDGSVSMTAGLTLSGDPSLALHATPKQYVDGISYLTAGLGLTKTGSVLNIGASTGISVNADNISLATIGTSTNGVATFAKVNVDAYGRVASYTSVAAADITALVGTIQNASIGILSSGTGLSGGGTFTLNQSGNQTIIITSNATSANTVSSIVARDGSGNFNAGTITASLSGNASSATNLAAGSAGAIPYQTSASNTSFMSIGSASQIFGVNTGGTGYDFKTVSGTNVTITNAANSLAISIPQSVATGATPTFAQLSITNSPSADTHAATKSYVDSVAQGLRVKQSVKVTTTTNLPISAGTITTLTLSSALTSLDGITLATNDRILVKDQTGATQNGLYVYTNSTTLTRSSDADNTPTGEVVSGIFTFVEEGASYADSGWVLATPNPITLGTTGLTFSQFSGAGQISAGNGMIKTGNVLDVVGTAGRIVSNVDSIDLATVSQGATGSFLKLGIDSYGRVFTNSAVSASDITGLVGTIQNASIGVLSSGNGISGGGTFTLNQSGNQTVTISSNATSANTSNTIVYRDASGNFAAGVIAGNTVGIGTASPTGKLHVEGVGVASGGLTGAIIRINDTAGTSVATTFTGIGFESPNSGPDFVIGKTTENTTSSFSIKSANTELVRIRSGGNVGIGTTSPSVLLHAKGAGEIIRLETSSTRGTGNNFIQFNDPTGQKGYAGYASTSNDHLYLVNVINNGAIIFGASSSEAMRILPSGNVGVGTSSPDYKLHVAGTAKFTAGDANNFFTFHALNELNYWNGTTGATMYLQYRGGDLDIGNNKLYVKSSSGYVGIGTPTPLTTLDVRSQVASFSPMLRLFNSGTSSGYQSVMAFYTNNSTSTPFLIGKNNSNDSNGSAFISNQANTDMIFETNGTESMRITAAGKLGIGITLPEVKFQVVDTSLTSTTVGANVVGRFQSNGSNADCVISFSNGVNAVTKFGQNAGNFVWLTDNTTERMRLTNAGNLGIGTFGPSGRLDIYSNTSSGTSTEMLKMSWQDNSWGLKLDQIHTGSAIDYAFRIRNATPTYNEALYIKPTGNIGIGTTNPTAKLEISGGASLTGTLTFNGSAGASGQVLTSQGSAAPIWTTITGGGGGSYLPLTGGTLTGGVTVSSGNIAVTNGQGSFSQGIIAEKLPIKGNANNNAAIGINALFSVSSSSGAENVAIGTNVLLSDTTGSYNIGLGAASLYLNKTGNYNIALGNAALYGTTSGYNNIAIGQNALYGSTNANHNIAIGANALYSSTNNSSYLVAIGMSSLASNTTGTGNVGVGLNTLSVNTSGGSNTAIGTSVLQSNTTGLNNTALGNASLQSNTTGIYNTAVGYAALNGNTNGSYSTALGLSALQNSKASSNIGLGYMAGYNITTGSSNTIIGSLMGTTGMTSTILIGAGDVERLRVDSSGYMLVGYTSSNGAYQLQVNGQIFATSSTIATSDQNYKENISSIQDGLTIIKSLNPVQFNWKPHPVHSFDTSTPTVGFIAQEVKQSLIDKPYLNSIVKQSRSIYEKDGEIIEEDFLGIAESNLIAILTKAVQELSQKVEELEAKILNK